MKSLNLASFYIDRKSAISQLNLKAFTVGLIFYAPFVIVLTFTAIAALPQTRSLVGFLVRENSIIQVMTFLIFLWAGIRGFFFARLFKRQGEKLSFYFYLAFSTALIFIAMEEIAWGQSFLQFNTPQAWSELNAQDELTLHNVVYLQDHLEILPLAAGILGLIGISLSDRPRFEKIMPPSILLTWFIVIATVTGIDFLHDYYIFNANFDKLVNALDEIIEWMIAIAAFLMIWLNRRKFMLKSNSLR